MFARVSRASASPDKLDELVDMFEHQLLPQIRDSPGFIGAAALGDRASGRGTVVTYWASAQAMAASEATASAGRGQTAARGVTMLDLQRYELVLVERVAPAAVNVFVRTNELDAAIDKLEDSITFVRDQVLPNVRSQKGFRALLMGVDRQSGHCMVSSIWETAADLEASEAAVREQRREAGNVAGAGDVRVEQYQTMFVEMKQAVTAG
jgi:heme-degrading monooxygenase HmoA